MTRRLHEPAPPDGWWWVRLSPATPRGADHRWTIVRILDGAVQPHGTSAWYVPTAGWLRDAEWVPAEPPAGCGPPTAAVTRDRRASRRARAVAPDNGRVRRVAAEIVDVFVNLSDAAAAYYARHPDDRDELVAAVCRLVRRATA
ncbi:MAG: hypothetical protein U0804_24110 [Gemmataceae bacterium]